MVLDYFSKKINYIQEGEGADVLILHGWGASIAAVACITNCLKKHFKVTVIDFFGFGQSDEVSDYTVSDYVKSVEFVIKKLQLNLFAIVAHSFGGRVAIKYLSENNIPKLILTSSAGIKPKRRFKYYAKVYSYKILKRIPLLKRFVKNAGSSDYKQLSTGMKKTFINIVNEDLSSYAKNIKCETLIIFGKNDRETPLYMAKKLNKLITGSGVVILKGAGHFAYAEKSAEFNLIVKQFLNINSN